MPVVVALVRTNWSGTTGGPGLTQTAIEAVTDPHTWDATAAQQAVDAVRAAWFGCATYLPDNIKLDVNPVVDIFTHIDGELVGSYSAATVPSQVVGTSAATFSMAAGIKINLNTGMIRNGRRVRGGIFVVPAVSTAFTTDGLVLAGARTTFNTAWNTCRTTLATNNKTLTVWSRPIPDGKPHGPRDGATAPVSAIETSEKGAILRGRRD